jgi:sarcosine oxidase
MSVGSYDAIVVGVGGMGSATAFELARRGHRVLGLEQHDLGHDQGASHGHTRIIRQAYYEHAAYVPMVQRAFEGWCDLEQRVGRPLLTGCGCLSIGQADSTLLAGVRASAELHSLPVEDLSAENLRRRFPAFCFGDHYHGILEHSAGILYVEECVLAQVQAARELGADIRAREPVTAWQAQDGSVEVQTTHGRYRAQRLVLTAGPWAASLLADWGACLTIMRQVAFWFGTSQPALFRRDRFPVYICDIPEGLYYGFPMISPEGPKVARHYGAPQVRSPAEVDRSVSDADEAGIRQFLCDHLPAVDGKRQRASVCLYTLTPDRHFVLDVHPDHPEVMVAAGFSGHGFKFAPVVGEILADLAERDCTDWPIDLFRLRRFATPISER